MKKYSLIVFFSLLLFAGCKSNQEAYSLTYQRLKAKEEAQMDANARTAMDVPRTVDSNHSDSVYLTERLTVVLGEEKNVSAYNLVARSFINRTNARGYYSQVKEDGLDAVLVQNENSMYRIVIASFLTKEEAESELKRIKNVFTEAQIVVRQP